MRSSKRLSEVFCGVVAILVATSAQLLAEPPHELIEKLTSESYPERVQAEGDLLTWAERAGEPAKSWLFEQQQSAENPETRRRCYAVLRSLVLEELTRQRPGFVGIRMRSLEIAEDDGRKVYGVEVIALTPGSPAEEAGLREMDIVLELNGKSWTRSRAEDEFAERIAELRGGDTVKIKILRGQERFDVELVLTYRPWSIGLYSNELRRRAAPFAGRNRLPANEADAENEVFQDWMKKQESRKPVR